MKKLSNLEIINILMKSPKVDKSQISDGKFTFAQYEKEVKQLKAKLKKYEV